MKRDKVFQYIQFNPDYTMEDWDALVRIQFGPYFSNSSVLENRKQVLRTELISYVQLSTKPDYLHLLNWSFQLCENCITADKQKIVELLADSFEEINETDASWMTNVLTQPDYGEISSRDKVAYCFRLIDETLEGVFKTRFKLLNKLVAFKYLGSLPDNTAIDLGKLIRNFPVQVRNEVQLFLADPFFSLPTNQWRNIAAHKSYEINVNNIVVKYGKNNNDTLTMSYDNFYSIFHWTQHIYKALRLGQVLSDLNHLEDIISKIGSIENINIRFESSLMHVIHQIQMVGFKFISSEDQGETFCIKLRGQANQDTMYSLLHASQCMDQLSCAMHDDRFTRDIFKNIKVCVVDSEQNELASATIPISVALKKVTGEITVDQYLEAMHFKLKR